MAAVKAALPERAAPGGSGEPGGGGSASGSSTALRMALQRRHAALFVLQECGLAAGHGNAAATGALVPLDQFRKCRVVLPKLGEKQAELEEGDALWEFEEGG